MDRFIEAVAVGPDALHVLVLLHDRAIVQRNCSDTSIWRALHELQNINNFARSD